MKKIIILCALLAGNFLFAQADSSDYDKEFVTVQVEAQFPGGAQAWRKYLERNLNVELAMEYIKIPKRKKSARQTVIVEFRVDKEGKISEVRAVNASEVHPKLAEEAIRVIKNGPDWVPATQNGKAVIFRQRQSITWVVEKE